MPVPARAGVPVVAGRPAGAPLPAPHPLAALALAHTRVEAADTVGSTDILAAAAWDQGINATCQSRVRGVPQEVCSSTSISFHRSFSSRPWKCVLTIMLTWRWTRLLAEQEVGLLSSPHTPCTRTGHCCSTAATVVLPCSA